MNGENNILFRLIALMKSVQKSQMSHAEKDQLWGSIMDSLEAKRLQSDRKRWFLAAASIMLLLVAGAYYLANQTGSFEKMAQVAGQTAISKDHASLILADHKVVDLESQNSKIEYSDQGRTILIDSLQNVSQRLGDAEVAYNTLVVPFGKRSMITLLDGTKIWLNSGSKLVYPTQFSADSREVFLEGQAYFDVAHQENNPFFVLTNDVKIKVLGTAFDVSAYLDDPKTQTVLVRGSVELSTNKSGIFQNKKAKLTPGTMVTLEKSTDVLKSTRVQVDEYVSWKEGYLVLRSAPLSEIIKKLSRFYKVEISLKDALIANETFSGTLDLADTADQVLEAIAATTSLNARFTERRFLLERK